MKKSSHPRILYTCPRANSLRKTVAIALPVNTQATTLISAARLWLKSTSVSKVAMVQQVRSWPGYDQAWIEGWSDPRRETDGSSTQDGMSITCHPNSSSSRPWKEWRCLAQIFFGHGPSDPKWVDARPPFDRGDPGQVGRSMHDLSISPPHWSVWRASAASALAVAASGGPKCQ